MSSVWARAEGRAVRRGRWSIHPDLHVHERLGCGLSAGWLAGFPGAGSLAPARPDPARAAKRAGKAGVADGPALAA